MDIKYRLYPYPVLTSETDDYLDSTFQFVTDVTRGIRELKFSFKMELENEGLHTLIEEGNAEFLVHIECSQTCYREIMRSSDLFFQKNIPENLLNGKVSICAFIVAAKDLENYKNAGFNEDYQDTSFYIERGSILAIGGQFNLTVVKDVEELAKVPSIFTICRYAANTDKNMEINLDGEKITIALSDSSFKNYKLLVNSPSLLPVFHAMIIIPALIYVFETLRRDGTEDYETRRWYAVIRKTLAKYNVGLNEDTLENIPSYDLAQKLLELPIDKGLEAIATFTVQDNDEEADEQ